VSVSANSKPEIQATELEVQNASGAIADGYAAEDQRAVTSSREAEGAALAKLEDLHHRLAGAELRIERARLEADTFAQDHACDLLEERTADARELARKLTRAGHELVQLHRAHLAMRTDIDALVSAIPGAVPRSDGPPASHAWERQLRDLERVVKETPEVPAPLPRWSGLQHRQQQDDISRREKAGATSCTKRWRSSDDFGAVRRRRNASRFGSCRLAFARGYGAW
jgi:hypothetical protein